MSDLGGGLRSSKNASMGGTGINFPNSTTNGGDKNVDVN